MSSLRKPFGGTPSLITTVGLLLVVLVGGLAVQVPAASASKGNLATITGAVLDNQGRPVSGALISLMKEGAGKVIKQTRSDIT
jgi:protocatechuate 3,4-dioxygenase beta subunit